MFEAKIKELFKKILQTEKEIRKKAKKIKHP